MRLGEVPQGWSVITDEITPYVYRVLAVAKDGRRIEATSPDDERITKEVLASINDSDRQVSAKRMQNVSAILAAFTLGLCTLVANAQYAPPLNDKQALRGLDFSHAQLVGQDLTQMYQTCDQQTTRGGCATDPARNSVFLKFPDNTASDGSLLAPGPVFFDAKMAIDADGSALSKKAERPNQPETALRYPTTDTSLDSEQVPYIVMPLGSFRQETGVALGDLAAVVKDGKVSFAIVGDLGPRTHLGEGSMALHAAFGHLRCEERDAENHCMRFVDVSLDPPVLYFVFPDTRKLLIEGLSAQNINARIDRFGAQLWSSFLIEQKTAHEAEGGTHAD